MGTIIISLANSYINFEINIMVVNAMFITHIIIAYHYSH